MAAELLATPTTTTLPGPTRIVDPTYFSHGAALASREPLVVRVVALSAGPGMGDGPPRWLGPVVARIRALLDLDPGWDGYGAHRIDPSVLRDLLPFLAEVLTSGDEPPSLVPTSRGGIQVEWHGNGRDVEVAFEPGCVPEAYVHDQATAHDEERPTANPAALVREWIPR